MNMGIGIKLPLLGLYTLCSLVMASKYPSPLTLANLVGVGGIGGAGGATVVARNREAKRLLALRSEIESELSHERDEVGSRERALYEESQRIERYSAELDGKLIEIEKERDQWLSTREQSWVKLEDELRRECEDRLRQLDQREVTLMNERERVERDREINELALEKQLEELARETEAIRLENEAIARQWVADALEPKNEEIATLQGELEGLKRQLDVATYPVIPRGRSRIERELYDLIPALYKLGFTLDYYNHESTPNRDRVWLKPRHSFDIKDLEKHSGLIQSFIGSKHTPVWEWTDGGMLLLTISTQGVNTVPKTSKKAIEERIQKGEQWLIDVVSKAFHFRICGENGSGKSELFNNLYCIAKYKVFDGELPLTLIDPKFPLSPWIIEGKPFIPQYQTWESAPGGVEAMACQVEARLKQARDSFKPQDWTDEASHPFTPSMWAIDETDTTMARYKKEIKDNLRVGLKVGRALRVMVLYMCQSYLPSDIGLQHPDLSASAHILLSTCADAGIDDLQNVNKERRLQLKEEVAYLASEGCKYYALVKYRGCTPFIARLPKPKAYAHLSSPGGDTHPHLPLGKGCSDSVTSKSPDRHLAVAGGDTHPHLPLGKGCSASVTSKSSIEENTINDRFGGEGEGDTSIERARELLLTGANLEHTVKTVWGMSKNYRSPKYKAKIEVVKKLKEEIIKK